MEKNIQFEVGIIGAGLAGSEAAVAASSMGRKTLLISLNLNSIASLSGDNIFGGDYKSSLLEEIQNLGGLTPETINRALLFSGQSITGKNISLVDRRRYFLITKHYLERIENLSLFQSEATQIIPGQGCLGIETITGQTVFCKTVVVCPGTFLKAKFSWGKTSLQGGQYGERAADALATSLEKFGLLGRYHWVEASPRLNGDTVDYAKLTIVEPSGDYSIQENSFKVSVNRNNIIIPNKETEIDNFQPQFNCFDDISNRIKAKKDELIEFFIRSEGQMTEEVILEGCRMSYSLPVQEEIIQTMPGLRQALISRPGYRVKYRIIDSKKLSPSLETKTIEGLFTAGQINGTSGYEEAAAQGLMAGINAALKARGEPPFILDRSQAYIGVLIDDLVTKGVDEPYRMYTSRAEHRLPIPPNKAVSRMAYLKEKLKSIENSQRKGDVSRETFDQ